jgi:flagellar FliJ protein
LKHCINTAATTSHACNRQASRDAAIAQQLKTVEQSKHSTQLGRGEFNNTQRKLKSFDTLQQRHIETQVKAEAKQEQRAMDEYTGRVSAYKMLNANNE